jgi:hypothetical protein
MTAYEFCAGQPEWRLLAACRPKRMIALCRNSTISRTREVLG